MLTADRADVVRSSDWLLWTSLATTILLTLLLVWVLSADAAKILAVIAAVVGLAMIRWSYTKLVVLLLLILSEIGLPNKVFAITLPNGDNLIGIRDVVILLVIAAGLIKGRHNLRVIARHPLIRPGLWLTILLPLAAAVGVLNKGNGLIILREMFALGCGWLIALVVAANIREWATIRRLLNLSVVLGVLVAIGGSIEIISGNRLQIVSVIQDMMLDSVPRNWPDGFIFMCFAWSMAAAVLFSKDSKFSYKIYGCVTIVIGTGFLLAGMRSHFYSFIVTILAFLALSKLARNQWVQGKALLLVAAVLVSSAGIALYTISKTAGAEFVMRTIERYQSMVADAGGRLYELDMVSEAIRSHPLFGTGLGVRYRETLDLREDEKFHDTGTLVHNISAYYLLKYGPVGLLLFATFGVRLVGSTYRLLKTSKVSEPVIYSLGLLIFFNYCLLEGQAGNIFGDIRQMPIVSILLGLLVALSQDEVRQTYALAGAEAVA